MVVVSVEHCSVTGLAICLDTKVRQKPRRLSARPTPSIVNRHDVNARLRIDVTAESPELTLNAANGDLDLPIAITAVARGSPAGRRLCAPARDRIGKRYDSWLTVRLNAQILMSQTLDPSENNFNDC